MIISIAVNNSDPFLGKKLHLLDHSQETTSEKNSQPSTHSSDDLAEVSIVNSEQNLGTTAL